MKIIRKILPILIVLAIIISSGMMQVVNADEPPTTGSLTIHKKARDSENPEAENKPLPGVTFRIYKVDADEEDPQDEGLLTSYEGWNYAGENDNKGGTLYSAEGVTGDGGTVKFDNLPLGRYLVEEVSAPPHVKDKVAKFLIDIPHTEDNGTTLNYNPEVSPKNDVVYKSITLEKKGNDGEVLKGVKFKLQKKKQGVAESWEDLTAGVDLETDQEGKIVVDGLEVGDYRFIEDSLGNDPSIEGYILDNFTQHTFSVTGEAGDVEISKEKIEVINEKPTIEKNIESITVNENSTNAKTDESKASANKGDTITYNVVLDVPSVVSNMSTYKFEDTIDENLEFGSTSEIKVVGVKRAEEGEDPLSQPTHYNIVPGEANKLTIDFVKDQISNYKQIKITYTAKIKDDATHKKEGYSNSAKLLYSNKVTTKYDGTQNSEDKTDLTTENSEIVKTGGLKIHKKNTQNQPLQGAKFKIAQSEDDAKNSKFIKDSQGNDIEISSGETGDGDYLGLAYGEYWLVETQAPAVPGKEGEYYNLLKDPQQINVGDDSYTTAIEIVNKRGTILPDTGGIGTLIFTLVGIILIIIGIVFYKKNDKED